MVLAAQGRDLPAVADLAYRRRALELLIDLGVLTIAYYASFRAAFSRRATRRRSFRRSSRRSPWSSARRSPRSTGPANTGCRGARRSGISSACSAGAWCSAWSLAMMLVLTLYRFEGFSRGVFVIDAVVAWLLLVGSRAATSRIQHYLRRQHTLAQWTLIYGAGRRRQAGRPRARQNRDLKLDPIGFIDDDPAKQNTRIDGIPVLGALDDLERLAAAWGVTDVIVSARNVDPDRLEALRERSGLLGIRVRRMKLELDELRPAARCCGARAPVGFAAAVVTR